MAKAREKPPERILLIRLSSIGDIVLTTPLIRLLRRRFPNSRIDFITKARFADLLRYHPGLSNLIEFPDHATGRELLALRRWLRSQKFDIILDLHKNMRSQVLTRGLGVQRISRLKKYGFRRSLLVRTKINLYHTIVPVYRRYIATAVFLGIEDDGRGTEIVVPESINEKAARNLPAGWGEDRSCIALVPGAGFSTKRWPAQHFAELARKLQDAGHALCVVGDASDRALAEVICAQAANCIDLTAKLTLLESAAILGSARLVVTNDSGMMHVSEAMGTPVVAIFGSTVRELGFYPILPGSQVVENSAVRCRPCSHIGKSKCPKGHFLCMSSLEVEWVLQAVLSPPAPAS